jgi:membrane protease subunit HflK
MVWGNENNRNKSPWDDEPQKNNKPTTVQPNFEDLFRRGHNSFNDAYKKLKSNDNSGGGNSGKLAAIIVAIISFVWLSTGFYVVDEGEQALVIRFGKYQRTASTGLNYHLPEPIEQIIKEKVETLRKEEIGFRSNFSGRDGVSDGSAPSQNVMQESLMLTGDENIVDINFIVQWKIASLKDYVFNIYNSRETVRSVAESAMREIVGNTTIDNAIAEGRSNIEHEAKILSQKILDTYNSGVQITTLKLLRSDPPAEVIDAFRDVQTARTDKEREINRALAFHNEVIPKARGDAAQITSESEGYKKEVVERAKGDAGRFELIFNQYRMAKDITKKRLYLEAMEQILQGMDKTIIDNQKNSGIVPYLPLNQLDKGK